MAGDVRATYNLYSDDVSRRRSSGTNGGEAALTDNGTEDVTGDYLTLVVGKSDWDINYRTEGGEEESGRGRGKVAHGEGRVVVEDVGVGERPLAERVREEWTAVWVEKWRETTERPLSKVVAGGKRLLRGFIRTTEDGIRAG